MALNARNAKWYALGFGALSVFMLAGSALFLSGILEERASLEWPRTPGSVIASYSERTCGGYRTSHRWEARIIYQYRVAGVDHRGHRSAGTSMYCSSDREDVTKWLAANYPIGKTVEVYFDPADPDAAFLHPGVVNIIEEVMVFACAIISIMMAWGAVIARKAARLSRVARPE